MANYRTTADLQDATLMRAGELTDGTSAYETAALGYLNSVYRAVLAGGSEFGIDCGEPWIWAQASAPQTLQLKAAYTTGSVTLTNASTTGSFSSAPSASLAGYYLKLESVADWYQISSHTAATTSFTLDQAFIGSTVTGTYQAVKTDYTLSTAVCRLCAPMVVYRDNITMQGNPERGQIYEIDANTMIRKYPRMLLSQGIPDKYCIISQSNADSVAVRFNSYPLEDCRVEIPYIAVASDLTDSGSSIPLIPFGFREVLVHGAAYYLMLDKSDNRADMEMQLAKAKLLALVNHNRKSLSLAGGKFGRMIARAVPSRRYPGGPL